MEREVVFSQAYDKRNPNPSKSYGIHGVNLAMYLKGEKGVVQFIVYTNWHLPHVQEELIDRAVGGDRLDIEMIAKPMPADLGYHSYTQMYEGQLETESCPLLDGHKCYYGGSSTNAYNVYDVLLKEGSEGAWRELEEYYDYVFNELGDM